MGGSASAAEAVARSNLGNVSGAAPAQNTGSFHDRRVSETSDAGRLLSAADRRRAWRQTKPRHQPVTSHSTTLPGIDPSRRGGASSQSVATVPHILHPVPRLPVNFDWRSTYCELQVHREHANSAGDLYAYWAFDRAINVIDEELRAARLLCALPAGETGPIAIYDALQQRKREITSAQQGSKTGPTQQVGRDLRCIDRLCHRKAFELDLRARDFADSFPAAASPGATAAHRMSTVANLIFRTTSDCGKPENEASAATAEPPSRFLPTPSTPGSAQDAAPSLGEEIRPADFHALQKERERYRESGNFCAVGVYDAAIAVILHKLQHVCDGHFSSMPDYVLNEPERAYTDLYRLWCELALKPESRYQRCSIATQLLYIRRYTHHKLVQLAGRADEFAALCRATPSPRPPAAIADPQALGHWLGSEAALARTRLAFMQWQSDMSATQTAAVEHTYFTGVQRRLAAGYDPWSVSRDFLRGSAVANPADSEPLLLPSHRRLLKAIADPSLGKTSNTIQAQAPPASRFAEPQPESPNASRSASLPSVYPDQPEPIRRTPNPAYQPLPAEHGHAR